MLTKVFHFDAPRQKYHCDAAILWCFDNRFELGFRKFLKRIGVLNSDPIKIAGGAKSLASPERETDREFVLEQIRKSIRLHGTKRVILMLHSDCGGPPGSAATRAQKLSITALNCNALRQVFRRLYRGSKWKLILSTSRASGRQNWSLSRKLPVSRTPHLCGPECEPDVECDVAPPTCEVEECEEDPTPCDIEVMERTGAA